MADKTLRGEIDFYTAAAGVVVGVAPNVDLPAGWTAMDREYFTEDGFTLSHSESIEDEMVLNETVAIDDYRVSEEWMLSFSTKDYQAPALQKVLNGNALDVTAAASGTVEYTRIPLRKGPAVVKQAICVRIDDSPYRVVPTPPSTTPPSSIRTQISFINASQRDGFESTLGPKQQGGMINFNFKGLIYDLPGIFNEVGYIDLTTADALP